MCPDAAAAGNGALTGRSTSIETAVPLVDRLALSVLVALILGYQLQTVAPWIATFRLRELLLGYLYVRAVVFYRGWAGDRIILAVGAFVAIATLVGVHTLLRYGAQMAIDGTLRFLFVPLIAPLIAVIGRGAARTLLYVWLGFVVAGAASAIFQALGGDMTWLVKDYISVRGGLVRFRTILGEPNRGGMASAIALLAAITVVRSAALKGVVVGAALVLLALSLSKAALVGWVLVGTFVVFASGRFPGALRFRESLARDLRIASVAVVLCIAGVYLVDSTFTRVVRGYLNQAVPSLAGQAEASKGIGEDIGERLFERSETGLRVARSQSDVYAMEVLVGSSFGVAGSAAYELRGEGFAMLPHNSMLELYLVGGAVLLGAFLLLVALALGRIVREASKVEDLFVSGTLMVIMAYSVAYPVVYEPVLGTPLWLVIGLLAQRPYRGLV